MKYKIVLTFSLVLMTSLFLSAQTPPDDYKKAEFFVGYSKGAVDGDTRRFLTTTDDRPDSGSQTFHGFEVSGTYNVSRYIGIKGDFSGHYESGNFSFPDGDLLPMPRPTVAGSARNSLYNVLAGVQFKDNASTSRFKPFAHVLVGIGQARTDINASCSPAINCSNIVVPQSDRERGFAGAFGGGLDIRLNERFDLRAGQLDYNPVILDSGTLHNFRLGIGIVIK